MVRRQPSKDNSLSKQGSKSSFSDLITFRKHAGTASLISTSSHSQDMTLEGESNHNNNNNNNMVPKTVQDIRQERQQQLARSGHETTHRQDSAPPPPAPYSDAARQEADLVAQVTAHTLAMATFESNVHQWIALFPNVAQSDFERAVAGELLNLVAAVPICAHYTFWQGFCTAMERRMGLPATARVLLVLRRVHPQNNLRPLKPVRRNKTGRRQDPPGGGRGGRGRGGGRGGRGGRGSGRGGRGRGPRSPRSSNQSLGSRRSEQTKLRDSTLRRPSGEEPSSNTDPPSLASATNSVSEQTLSRSAHGAPWQLTVDPAAGHLSFSSLETRTLLDDPVIHAGGMERGVSPTSSRQQQVEESLESMAQHIFELGSNRQSSARSLLSMSSDEQRAMLRRASERQLHQRPPQRRASSQNWETHGLVHCRQGFPPENLIHLLFCSPCDRSGMRFARSAHTTSATGRPISSYALCGCSVGLAPSHPKAKIRIQYHRVLVENHDNDNEEESGGGGSASSEGHPLCEFLIQSSTKEQFQYHILEDGTQGSPITFVAAQGDSLPVASYDGNGEPILSFQDGPNESINS